MTIEKEQEEIRSYKEAVSYTHLLYHVNENDRKRMLGHSFGNDVTNRVYGHRDLKDLKMEIEKIDKERCV